MSSASKPTYVAARAIQRQYAVSDAALRRWANGGVVSVVRCPGGKRLYNLADVQAMFGEDSKGRGGALVAKAKVIYARVSSDKHFSRKGFLSLLERVYGGSVEEVVVSHRDRLCRFAFELVEWIFAKHAVKLVVLNQADLSTEHDAGNRQQELAEDLVSVVNVFVARNNGLRAAANRRKRASEHEQQEQQAKKAKPSTSQKGKGKAQAKDPSREEPQDSSLSD
jgi:putative resolvase